LDLVRYGSWFSQDRGVVTVCELVIGDVLDNYSQYRNRSLETSKKLREEGIVAFPQINVVANIERGMIDVVQANGLAGLHSNTVLMGWPKDEERLAEILAVVKRLESLNRSLIIGRLDKGDIASERRRREIHIWWGGLERNGDLMLLLGHLLTRNPQWRGSRIVILSIVSNELMRTEIEGQLTSLLPQARIEAESRVIIKPKPTSIRDIIHAESANADVVFLGLATPDEAALLDYAQRMNQLADGLKTVFFVKNASLFVGELV